MFNPARMMRCTAVILEGDERAVLRALGALGVLHLSRARAEPGPLALPPRDHRPELARWDEIVSRIAELRKLLGLPPAGAAAVCPPEMSLPQAEQKIHALTERVQELVAHRERLSQSVDEATTAHDRVAPYRGLELPLDQADRFSFLHFVSGQLPAQNWEQLQRAIGDHVAVLPLPEVNGRQPLIALTTRPERRALERALAEVGFQPDAWPVIPDATLGTLAEAGQRKCSQLARELAQWEASQKTFVAAVAPEFAALESLAQFERPLLEAAQHFARTEAAVVISGWAPAVAAGELADRVRQITAGRCVIETTSPEPDSPESIPVLLQPGRWLRPFAALVRAYGLPRYAELEPTLFVALSYLLMFGVMFGDVGHGAVLALGGGLAWRCGRAEKIRDAGLLILAAGISAMIFGWVYGSCFGLESFKSYALWRDPLAGEPLAMMYGALGIGVVMISLGLVLNIINCFRRGEVIAGFLDKFGVVGVVFYWGALALVTKYAALEARGLIPVALGLFVALPLVGWALKGPLELLVRRRRGPAGEPDAGWLVTGAESLVGAFEAVVSYLANTISFVRLAAYAMSHAALLVAVFTMAEALKHFPWGGGVLSIVVIVGGNLGVIGLEALIAAVQALRLEYYEFFSKFFSGSGPPFTPFCLPKYDAASPELRLVASNKPAGVPPD